MKHFKYLYLLVLSAHCFGIQGTTYEADLGSSVTAAGHTGTGVADIASSVTAASKIYTGNNKTILNQQLANLQYQLNNLKAQEAMVQQQINTTKQLLKKAK